MKTRLRLAVAGVLLTLLFGRAAVAEVAGIHFQQGFPMRVGQQVMLVWVPVAGAKSYRVTRTDLETRETTVVEVFAPSFVDGGAPEARAFSYQVQAVKTDGSAGVLSEVREVGGKQLPPPPRVSGAFRERMTVWILWEAVSEARYYNLYRAADGAPAVLLATVQDTRYADRQADPGTRYEYFVRSVNASGEGENSAPSVAPPAKAADDPKAVPGAGKVVELRRVIKSGVAYALKEPVDLQRAGGLLFVSDPAARSVFVLDDQGTLVRRLGPDTAGVNGRWGTPWGLCATASGNRVAVAFPDVGRVRVFSDGGEVLLDVGVPPPSAGDKVNARKPAPFDVVLLPDGGLWVTDSANAHVVRLDAQGNEKARLGAVRSEKNASGAHEPTYLAFDPQSETLYVVDSLAATILAVDGSGVVVRKWRRFSAPVGPLCLPKGISVTSAGDLLIVDGILSTVQRFTAEGELIAVYAKKDSKTVGVRGIVAAVEGNVPGQVFVASNLLGRVFELGVVSSP